MSNINKNIYKFGYQKQPINDGSLNPDNCIDDNSSDLDIINAIILGSAQIDGWPCFIKKI